MPRFRARHSAESWQYGGGEVNGGLTGRRISAHLSGVLTPIVDPAASPAVMAGR